MRKLIRPVLVVAALMFQMAGNSSALDIASQLNNIISQASHDFGIQVNLSGRQRMLTQKMTKETLLIALDIDAVANRENLKKTITLFDKTLIGLRDGDKSVGLVPTTSPEILAQLKLVATLWARFKPLVDKVVDGQIDSSSLKNIASSNLPLLAAMNVAVGMYAKISGSDLADLATVINLSGKQRMLTQKMTKELLLVAANIDQQKNLKKLSKTVALFERTLQGLLDGDDELGLPGTRDKKIRAQLGIVSEHWKVYKPILAIADSSHKGLMVAAELNLPLLKEMNRAVKMYEEQSKK